jgi:hypothetical protein
MTITNQDKGDKTMRRKSRSIIMAALAATAVAAALIGPAGAAEEVEKSENVGAAGRVKYVGGTELATDGRFLYSGSMNGETKRGEIPENGGLRVYKTTGKSVKQMGSLNCPGNDNDVEVVRKGLVVMGFHQNLCALGGTGLMTIDTSNPKRPKVLGSVTFSTGQAHTIKPYPGTDFVYALPGGLPGNGGAITNIVDVSDPKKPEVVGTFKPNASGCHDLSFFISKDKKLAFCAGMGETQIWDVSDPVAPVTIGRIHNPLIQFMHYPAPNHDGTLLAIDDEAFAAHDCNSGQSPTGRVWIYDISNPALPLPVSSFAPPRGGDGQTNVGQYAGWVDSWCLSHGLDWMPGKNYLGATWFTGGWSVLDLTDPSNPTEVAHFQAEDSATYSVLWHQGRLYTNDMHRGTEGFVIKGLK